MKRLDEIFTVTYGVNLELCYLTRAALKKGKKAFERKKA